MHSDRELRAMRTMAWERAKGELNSMLHTYYNAYDETDDYYSQFQQALNEFVHQVEDNGWQE